MSEEELTDRQVEGWLTSIQETTPCGKMLAFTTTEKYASDIFLPTGKRRQKKSRGCPHPCPPCRAT